MPVRRVLDAIGSFATWNRYPKPLRAADGRAFGATTVVVMKTRLRIATYNIHMARGLDRRVNPARIVRVLEEIDADVVALQEVLSFEGRSREENQALFIAENLAWNYCAGETKRLNGGSYGNVILSRWPIDGERRHDLSVSPLDRRGCLRADIRLHRGRLLHVFNVHLSTAFLERRGQARKLVAPEVLNSQGLRGPRVVLGDFNEWTRGLVSRLLAGQFESVDIRKHLRRSRTYPGILPIFHLDHIYFDPLLVLERLTLHKSRTALVASDHLPLVAEFRLLGQRPHPMHP